jgi:histidinol-phosphate aminotransferase
VVYPIAVQACGARAIVTPAKDWGHDLDAMAAAIEADTRVVFIANPNNPTGTWLTETAIRAFMASVSSDVVVVLDEAYTEYVTEAEYPDGVALLADYPNLIVTRTFSKAYGLAGLRAGYSICSAEIADVLNRVRGPFNVNLIAMAAATAALSDQVYLETAREVNSAGMTQLEAGFKSLDIGFIPSVGNFISFHSPVDAAALYDELLRRAVIVRPVGVYSMPNYLRVSIGLEEENAKFLEQLPLAIEAVTNSGASA